MMMWSCRIFAGKKPTSPVKDEEDVRSEAGTAISSGSETQTITLDDGTFVVRDPCLLGVGWWLGG